MFFHNHQTNYIYFNAILCEVTTKASQVSNRCTEESDNREMITLFIDIYTSLLLFDLILTIKLFQMSIKHVEQEPIGAVYL